MIRNNQELVISIAVHNPSILTTLFVIEKNGNNSFCSFCSPSSVRILYHIVTVFMCLGIGWREFRLFIYQFVLFASILASEVPEKCLLKITEDNE